MLFALILVSVGLAISLGTILFAQPKRGQVLAQRQQSAAEEKLRQKLEADLDKKRKELEEQKEQLADAKEQLKQAKKKLFDQKEADKGDRDLLKAREEVERGASTQLEVVRSELAQALHDVERLKSELAGKGKRLPERAPERPTEKAEAKHESAPEPKKYRELNDADREKMERLEHDASRERAKAVELDKELKRLKGRTETQNRIYLVTKGELDLIKDKFKALEKRLNRTLLESDLARRALADVEKKSGIAAGRTELTAEEIAASDRKVDEKAAADSAPQPTAETAPGPSPSHG